MAVRRPLGGYARRPTTGSSAMPREANPPSRPCGQRRRALARLLPRRPGPLGWKVTRRYPTYRGSEEVVYLGTAEPNAAYDPGGSRPADGGVTSTTGSASSTSPSRSTRMTRSTRRTPAPRRGVKIHFPPEEDRDEAGYYAFFVFDPDGIRVEVFAGSGRTAPRRSTRPETSRRSKTRRPADAGLSEPAGRRHEPVGAAPPGRWGLRRRHWPANCAACGLLLVPGFLHDRRDLGVGHEALPALLVPVEDHPDPIVLGGVAEDERALGPVLLALLALRRSRRPP